MGKRIIRDTDKMILTVVGSSSKGNCYALTSEGETLLIEAGISTKNLISTLQGYMKNIVGCIISHRHDDHSLYVDAMIRRAIRVYANEDTISYRKIGSNYFAKVMRPNMGYKIGKFRVIPFEVQHDVPCFGFIIEHKNMGRLMFITDARECEYKVDGVNHIMVESNFSYMRMMKNVEDGKIPISYRNRVVNSHMDIDTTCELLRANDLSKCSEVVLLHLSESNSDEEEFTTKAKRASGRPVYIAKKGLKLDLTKKFNG